MTTFNCNNFLFLPVSMKNESGGKWVEHPQTIGLFFFWPFSIFLFLNCIVFSYFTFPLLFSYSIDFSRKLKLRRALTQWVGSWPLALLAPQDNERLVPTLPDIKLLRKKENDSLWILQINSSHKQGFFTGTALKVVSMQLVPPIKKHPVSVVLLFSFSLFCGLCSQIVETFVWEKTAM